MNHKPMTELIVVRHGETRWNVEGRLQGHLDSGLSLLGVRQAEAIARRLGQERFGGLYSSDLGRAFQTAEPIARTTGLAIVTDSRLRERKLGVFQGLTMSEILERFPDDHRRFVSGDPDHAVPGGESGRQRYERTVNCVNEIAARHAGERVLIVTHGGVLNGLLRRALGIDLAIPLSYRLFNATINTFFVCQGAWKLGTWGDIHHLRDIGTIEAGAEANA